MNPRGILTGWLLCGVLDITAACVQARIQAGVMPDRVLEGVASALWGPAAMHGGAGMAAIGLLMHFTVALVATLVFAVLVEHIGMLRTAPIGILGPLYGAAVFGAMNYGTLPVLSWLRTFYIPGAMVHWPGPMKWPQLLIHVVSVGPPIVWGVRRATPARRLAG
jgi:hypothetical protein